MEDVEVGEEALEPTMAHSTDVSIAAARFGVSIRAGISRIQS
jgi:hypothetical protein